MCPGRAGQGAKDPSRPLALFLCSNLLYSEPISGSPNDTAHKCQWDLRLGHIYSSVVATHGHDEDSDHKQLGDLIIFQELKVIMLILP